MFFRILPITVFTAFLFCSNIAYSQVTIWQENFSGPNQGWVPMFAASNCGNNNLAGVVAAAPPVAPAGITYPAFRINDIEGACCTANPNDGGNNNGFWETNSIAINGFCDVAISANWGAVGPMECDFPAAPSTPGACTGTPADNGHDQLIFQYSLDGGPWTQFYYVCGGGADQSTPGFAIGGTSGDPGSSGIASINGLTGSTIQIRIYAANKANDEFYLWDNVRVSGIPKPTVNQPADITVCSGQNAVVPAFTGTGMPAPTYAWTNSNPGAGGIGLGASGNGNIGSFATPSGVTTPRVGTITVTPTSAGCPGDPVTFTVTVNPGLTPMLGTASLCTNSGIFSLNGLRDPLVPNGNWSGPGVTGTNFNPSAQNGVVNITFTPTGACAGPPTMTTITVSPAPTATFSPTTPVCSGSSTNLNVTFTGTGPWNFNLFAGPTNLGSFTANTSPFQIPVTPTGTTTYSIQSLMDANCNGANASVVQNVSAAPTGVLSLVGSNNICEGQNATVSVNFSGGSAPYTFVIAINGTDQAPMVTSSDPFQFPVALTTTSTITLTSVTSNGCTGTGSGTANVTIKPTPTATMPDGSTTICSGQPVPLQVTLTGTAPFILVYSINGVNQAPINTVNPFPVISATPTSGVNTYTLVSLTGSGCPGTVDGTYVITVGAEPTASFSPTTPVCAGTPVNLNINLTGTSPWSFDLFAGATLVGNFTPNTSPVQIPVTPTGTTTYTIQNLQDAACGGSSASVVQTVSAGPTGVLSLVGSNTICTGQNAMVSVDFSGGSTPYNFVIAVGGVDQASMVSNTDPFPFSVPLASSSAITLTSVTSGGCSGLGSGTANVTVASSPTATLTSGSATICNGQSLPLQVSFTGTSPYTFVYSINGVNQPPVNTPGPFFTINAAPSSGVNTYELESVSDPGCSGTVSGSFVITVGAAPAAAISGAASVCQGQPANLTVTFTGTGPYTFNYTANSVAQPPVTTPNNPYTLTVTPAVNTTYVLTSVDVSGCVGTVSGQGTVTISGSPSGSLQNGGNLLCSGQSDTLHFDFMGPGPYTFVYSINGVDQPAITTPSTTYIIPITPPVGMSDYVLESVSGPGCPGSAGGTYSVEVGTPPTATLSGTDTICANTAANLTINFTGTGPFVVNYTANGVAQPQIITSTNPYVFPAMPASTTSYVLTSVSAGGCSGTFSGTAVITVLAAPTGIVSGGQQICTNGSGTTIDFTFTGGGPYTFVYSANNIPQPPITTNNPTISIPVNPPNGTIYRMVSVTNGICSGTVNGQAIVFVFTPPTAVLSGSNTFCNSADTSVMIDFTGTQPFIITYSIDGVVQPPDTTFEDPFFIPVNTNTTTMFALVSVESPGCIGNAQGSATITVNYPPSYTNLQLSCNAVQNNYTVSFDVLNATLPLTLVSGSVSGSFTGNQFTSTVIPQANSYSFVFRDANNCGDITVSGPSTCNCLTSAGTMDLTDTIEVCQGATATAVHNNNFVDDGNDILRFILHTNPAIPVGTILAWNTTPAFTFLPGMQTGVTYYISAVAGNDDGSGNVDFADICAKISQGTPVVFHPLPTATLGGDGGVCAGSQFLIPVTLTGVPPYSLTWALNGVQQPTQTNIPTPSFQLAIQPAVTTTVTLVSVGDARCTTPVIDTAVITVNTAPQVQNLNISCNLATQTYMLQFIAQGTAPFVISGVSGAFVNDTFTSVPIPIVSNYSFQLTDANNCGQTTLSGMANCGCLTNAGVMDQTPVAVCQTDSVTVAAVTLDTLDPTDTLLYILHTNSAIPIGTILAWNDTPVFGFLPGMQTNITYYISAIAGNPDGSGMINLNDPCLDVAIGTPVVFNGLIGLLSSFDTLVCAGTPVELTVNFAGSAPFSFTITQSGGPDSTFANIPDDSYTWVFTPTQTTTIQLDSVSDQFCTTGSVSGVVNIIVPGNPVIQNAQTVCDENTTTYTVTFDMSGGTAPYLVDGNTGTITGTQFASDPIPFGMPYTFYLRDTFDCSRDTISGTSTCSCTTQAGTMDQTPLVLCDGTTAGFTAPTGGVLATGDVLTYYLVSSGTVPGSWTVIDSSSTPSFDFNSGTMTSGTAYSVFAVVGNPQGAGVDPADPCISVTPGPTVTWRAPVTATISGDTSICQGQAFSLTVDFTGQGFYTLGYTANGDPFTISTFTNPYPLIPLTPASNTTYVLTSVTGQGGCSGTVSGSATVSIAVAPQAVNVQTTCDFTTETYVLTFDISNGAAANSTYTVTGIAGTLTDTSFVSDAIPSGSYSVTVTNAEGCSTTITGTANCLCVTDAGTLPAAQINVCLPDDATLQAAANTNLDPDDVLQYILYEDVALLPQGILATSGTPGFGFTSNMTSGTTYFISAIAGNELPDGSVDMNDPCFSISNSVPVVFRDAPSADLMGTDTVCPGGNAAFQIDFIGNPPFEFVYAINNTNQPELSAPGNAFNITTNNVQVVQTFTLVSVQDAFCLGTVNGQADVQVYPVLSAAVESDVTICAGSSTTLTLALSGGTSYNVTVGGGPQPIQLSNIGDGAQFDVTPSVTTTYSITAVTATGNICPATLGPDATVTISTLGGNATLSDFNGFNVSCADATDGSITLVPTGGVAPVTAVWSNGDSGLQVDGLAAGDYSVVLTDQIGCVDSATFTLTAPPGIRIDFSVIVPRCFGDNNGTITVQAVAGGSPPYILTLNAMSMTPDTFPIRIGQLSSGNYVLEVEDANGCSIEEDIDVPEPAELIVDLGPDREIALGDSTLLEGLTNATSIDTFIWSPTTYLSNADSLLTYVRPPASQVYNLMVRDTFGCIGRDEMLLTVRRDNRIFIPNIIRTGSSENGSLMVYGGPELREVRFFRVYDRWGELVFENLNMPKNDPNVGWRGRARGKDVMPGVYIYVAEVIMTDGTMQTLTGDVTVVR